MFRKERLFTPGPVPLPPEVIKALGQQIIHHRTPEFSNIFKETINRLQQLYKTDRDIVIFSSSGTGGMEASILNFFSDGDKVLVINGGKFGQRWLELSKVYGLKPINYEIEWGKTYNKEDIEKILKENPDLKGILVQHSETSTTTYHDVGFLGSLARNLDDCILVVDGITSVGVYEVYPEELGIDVLITGSQKALMVPPGLAIVYYSERASRRLEKSGLAKYYFDIRKEAKKQKEGQTAYTPSISLIIALNESLKLILDEGLPNLAKRHQLMAEATRKAIQKLGLKLLSESPSNSATGVYSPDGINGDDLRKTLLKLGFRVAGGQDHLKGKILRIAHMGYFDYFDIVQIISALEIALLKHNYPINLGEGVKVIEETIKDI